MVEERKPIVEVHFSSERHVARNKAEMQIENSSEFHQRLTAIRTTEVATG
jgi:hypothetical protein